MARTSVAIVFIDSSVLYSACKSKIGASALLLAYCRKGSIQGFVSPYVITEVKRNLVHEGREVKQRLNFFLLQTNLKIVTPINSDIARCKGAIKLRDTHILAAALKCKAEYLITLDQKDFMQKRVKDFVKPIVIVTLRGFLKKEKLI